MSIPFMNRPERSDNNVTGVSYSSPTLTLTRADEVSLTTNLAPIGGYAERESGNTFTEINIFDDVVGIGTGNITPSEKLEVVGNITTTSGEIKIPNNYDNNFAITTFNVTAGNPTQTQVINNTFGGNLDAQMYKSVTTQVANQKILINCLVSGEWTSQNENKGLAIGVQVGISSSTRDIERPPAISARGRFLSSFSQSFHGNEDSTIETATLTYVYKAGAVNTYHFFPILVNTGGATSIFHLNSTIGTTDQLNYEIAGSYLNLQILST